MYDMVVIGAGCAGLTASIYGLRAGFHPVILEKNFYGGQIAITNEVENYPAIEKISGVDLATKLYEQARNLGVDIRFEAVERVYLSKDKKQIFTNHGAYEAKTVIIANGVERRKLGCKGEEEFTGKGVSYCATCDGSFFKGKAAAVVGGGNTALEDALYLAKLCSKVYLIHRRDSFRGEKILADTAKAAANIEILYDTVVEEIKGAETVSSVKIYNKARQSAYELPVNGVFVAIGLIPKNELYAEYLKLDEAGYFVADETCTTGVEGVYVAGDSRTKLLRQIITAAADGAVAGYQAAGYLNRI